LQFGNALVDVVKLGFQKPGLLFQGAEFVFRRRSGRPGLIPIAGIRRRPGAPESETAPETPTAAPSEACAAGASKSDRKSVV